MNFEHVSVLLNECIEGLNIKSDGVYVDCTLGGGGHSSQIVRKIKGLYKCKVCSRQFLKY